MLDITVGAAAGVIGSEASAMLHTKSGEKTELDVLVEIKETLHLLHEALTKVNKIEQHKTIYVSQNQNLTIRYEDWQGIYFLVANAATFNVTVSGLSSFQWSPTPGTYVRWQFPDNTILSLQSPSQQNYPIDLLYTNIVE